MYVSVFEVLLHVMLHLKLQLAITKIFSWNSNINQKVQNLWHMYNKYVKFMEMWKQQKGEQIWNITETLKLTAWNKQPKFGNNEGAIDPKSQTRNF